MKNPNIRREYKSVKEKINEGVHPVNLSDKSTYVSLTKVLVKKSNARYLIEVSDTSAEILAISSRSDDNDIAKFQTLMNKLYNLNLQGYL